MTEEIPVKSIRVYDDIKEGIDECMGSTYVPVFPDRTELDAIISRDVPKSESIALGLNQKINKGK